jgi:hypothetical protein
VKPGGGSPPDFECDWAEPALSFEELLRRNTGWAQTPERWQEQRRRRQLLEAETARIADALEAEGIPVRLGWGDIVALGDVTGLVAPVESFRAIRFLPVIAQRDRRPMLNALRYYQRHNPFGSHLRYAVVTSGQRVPFAGDLRGQVQQLHRVISRFAYEARNRFGVETVYRGTEFPVDQVLSCHPHANLLYAPRSFLLPSQWRAFLSWGHRFFGVHWRDNGRLVKPEEAIKYPFKPAELEQLEGPVIAWIYLATQGLKLAQPLGEFAEFWRELDRRRLKVLLVDGPDGARLCLVEKPSRPAALVGCRASRRRGEPPPENEIICQMAPQSRFCPCAEPVTLVRNYTENPKTWEGLLRLEEIKDIRRRARARWDANGAPDPESALATAEPASMQGTASAQVSGVAASSSCSSAATTGSSKSSSAMARMRPGRTAK